MRKGRTIRQTIDIMTKILTTFVLVFVMYFSTKIINNFAYDYFVFPIAAIVSVFMCGVNVGKSLEKIKDNKSIGTFTKEKEKLKKDERTEFYVNDRIQIVTNKKILKEVQEGNKVHIKMFDYNEIEYKKSEEKCKEEELNNEEDRNNIIRL